ncbi:subclass B1 metallo-beta-lactamase [Vibrio lentus]|uniref:ALI family subclass B1 metallo-beta-lactamase n=1 Tax=Vibrio lentus TaxID=136468 RepID=UPI000C8255C6|nr:ALI family subclass B1 metallo-beta-lactamase [Vibrio lentus]PMG49112.1 subclass B1 metallo-beta-lactamase [Vibrio lentus]
MYKITLTLLNAVIAFSSVADEKSIKPLQFEEIKNNVFLVKSYREFVNLQTPGNPVVLDANSLIYIDGTDAYLIDTPWNASNMPQLMEWIESKGFTLKKTVFSHFHEDQTGGLEYLQQHNFETYASGLTNRLLKHDNKKPTNHEFSGDNFVLLENKIEVFYPGAGHSKDNVVVWMPKEKVLVGGCLMRANEVNTIGWVGDADIKKWSGSAQKVLAKYPQTELVVPGHGNVGKGTSIIRHTVDIANQL